MHGALNHRVMAIFCPEYKKLLRNMKLQCLKLFIMTKKKKKNLEDFREISLVGSLNAVIGECSFLRLRVVCLWGLCRFNIIECFHSRFSFNECSEYNKTGSGLIFIYCILMADRMFGTRLAAIQEVPGSIPGYALAIFLEV